MKKLSPAIVCSLALALGCGKKSGGAPPEVTGLAAVPASAQVVLVADVPRLANSQLVTRAVDQLLARDKDLAKGWQDLHATCKIDPAQIQHATLAIGAPGKAPGSGPVELVLTGKLAETDFATCVRGIFGTGSGSVTLDDDHVYVAREGNRTLYFAFGRADTVVLATDRDFLKQALAVGKKVSDDPDMKRIMDLADQKAPLWGAGRIDDKVRADMAQITSGQLTGPTAFAMGFDPSNGAKISFGAVMATADDAKKLESFVKSNLGLAAYAAQAKSLGPLVDKIHVAADGTLVRFAVDLSIDDVNQLVSVLDGTAPAAQDSPPAKP